MDSQMIEYYEYIEPKLRQKRITIKSVGFMIILPEYLRKNSETWR